MVNLRTCTCTSVWSLMTGCTHAHVHVGGVWIAIESSTESETAANEDSIRPGIHAPSTTVCPSVRYIHVGTLSCILVHACNKY